MSKTIIPTAEESKEIAERMKTFPSKKSDFQVQFMNLSDREKYAADRYPYLKPVQYWTEFCDIYPDAARKFFQDSNLPLPDKLINLEAEQGTEEVHFTGENLEDLVVNIPEDARPIPDPFDEKEWEPRPMKTTVITRENIDDNPFA